MSPVELKTFAQKLLARVAAIRQYEHAFFGRDRLFINHAFNLLSPLEMSRADFNQVLLEANRLRFLSLARADMVELMNHVDVQESEIRHVGATFNFIVVG